MNNWDNVIPVLCAAVLLLAACGGGSGESGTVAVDETGSIDSGDTVDPNHARRPYDMYRFDTVAMSEVEASVETDSFSVLLKLVEVSTGAVIDEWDPQYSEDPALVHTVPVRGLYEIRVYSLEGYGDYSLEVTVSER